jgi:nucleotide-binding universal stress UspA family protein
MFERVLFATDFSEYARKTLNCIAGFPGAREIILLHILEEARSPRGGGEIGETLSPTKRNILREEKHRLESLIKNLKVTTEVKTSSDIAGAILETAEEKGVTLIVVGARGNSLVEGILLGSVSMAILRRSRISVLIMRPNIVEGQEGKSIEMSCPMILSRVLCPVDFSRFSDHAIDVVRSTPGVGEVILLNVVSQGETEVEIQDTVEKARDRLEIIGGSLAKQGLQVSTIVRTGNPGTEITRIGDEEEVSVIWISSHGKGWFRELLLGSTAYTVAMNAKQPVIVIHTTNSKGTNKAIPEIERSRYDNA